MPTKNPKDKKKKMDKAYKKFQKSMRVIEKISNKLKNKK